MNFFSDFRVVNNKFRKTFPLYFSCQMMNILFRSISQYLHYCFISRLPFPTELSPNLLPFNDLDISIVLLDKLDQSRLTCSNPSRQSYHLHSFHFDRNVQDNQTRNQSSKQWIQVRKHRLRQNKLNSPYTTTFITKGSIKLTILGCR